MLIEVMDYDGNRTIISVISADDVNLDSLSDCLNLDDGEYC